MPVTTIQKLSQGSIVRVNLPMFEGKFALGTIDFFQIIFTPNEKPMLLVWVDMMIDEVKRPFEVENLEPVQRIKNGFDNDFIADLITDKAA